MLIIDEVDAQSEFGSHLLLKSRCLYFMCVGIIALSKVHHVIFQLLQYPQKINTHYHTPFSKSAKHS